jgi:glycosyltransferase involved in cell wall biosynthesis
MHLLFLTLVHIQSVEERGIYQDLLRKFRDAGHSVTIVSPVERRLGVKTNFQQKEGVSLLQVKTYNVTRTNIVEKGIGTLALEFQYLKAIKKYLGHQKFDKVVYSTPPITLTKIIAYIKKRDNAKSYLLLKDIFPQNAVDMGMLKAGGFLHQQFVKKEKKLYALSDTIGCMSQANVDFILKHNPEIAAQKVEINPNSIQPVEMVFSQEEKNAIREKYNLPLDKNIFVYGGNLGKPQGVDFLIETIEENKNPKAFFLVVGNGTEYLRIKKWFEENQPKNAVLYNKLPKQDYDKLLAACDVGMLFLDKQFTIPNFPSRLLSYLEMRLPVLAATDPNTDVGDVVEKANCGYKVLAGDIKTMNQRIDDLINNLDTREMQNNAWNLLQKDYLVERSFKLVIRG